MLFTGILLFVAANWDRLSPTVRFLLSLLLVAGFHLAAALTWRDSVGRDVVLATFDRQLWEAAPEAGLQPWPEKLASDAP